MSADQQAVENIVLSFRDCWNRHDMAAFAQLFTEDADYVSASGQLWQGRAAIEQAHAALHSSIFKNSMLSIEQTSVRFLKPDVAVARSAWRLAGHTNPRGQNAPPRQGFLTNTLMKDAAGKWAIVASQTTNIIQAG